MTVNEFLSPGRRAAQEVSKRIQDSFRRGNCPYKGRMQPVIGDFLAQANAPIKDQPSWLVGRPVRLSEALPRSARNGREAPACMRCRDLTSPGRALTCRFLDVPACCLAHHRARSPCAVPGPPGPAQPLGSPPRATVVQVVREFLLPRGTVRKGIR